jgi:hypothetical protein
VLIGLSTTGWWILGYAVSGAVVLIAATLLVVINLLARRIVRQTAEITMALDGAMRNTTPLFDIALMNHGLESITRGLKKLSGKEGSEDERGILRRITTFLSRRT